MPPPGLDGWLLVRSRGADLDQSCSSVRSLRLMLVTGLPAGLADADAPPLTSRSCLVALLLPLLPQSSPSAPFSFVDSSPPLSPLSPLLSSRLSTSSCLHSSTTSLPPAHGLPITPAHLPTASPKTAYQPSPGPPSSNSLRRNFLSTAQNLRCLRCAPRSLAEFLFSRFRHDPPCRLPATFVLCRLGAADCTSAQATAQSPSQRCLG